MLSYPLLCYEIAFHKIDVVIHLCKWIWTVLRLFLIINSISTRSILHSCQFTVFVDSSSSFIFFFFIAVASLDISISAIAFVISFDLSHRFQLNQSNFNSNRIRGRCLWVDEYDIHLSHSQIIRFPTVKQSLLVTHNSYVISLQHSTHVFRSFWNASCQFICSLIVKYDAV